MTANSLQQLRGHLELELLFGNSELTIEKIAEKPIFTKKKEAFLQIPLLVLLNRKVEDPEENQLLNKMLATLKLSSSEYVVIPLCEQQVEDLLKKYKPKCILTFGQVSQLFGLDRLEDKFHCKYGEIDVISSYSAQHLLKYPEDKSLSWQALILLKNLLKS